MFVLDGGSRFVAPRTEMTYPGHNPKLHQNAADPVKFPVDATVVDLEDDCPWDFKATKIRRAARHPRGRRRCRLPGHGRGSSTPSRPGSPTSATRRTGPHCTFAERVTERYLDRGGGSMADPETGAMTDEATNRIALMDLAKAVQAGTVPAAYLVETAARSPAVSGYDILERMRRID